MDARTAPSFPALLRKGLAAGLGLVLADALATGLGRLPGRLAALSLGLAIALGFVAAVAARLSVRALPRPVTPLAVVLSLGVGLDVGSRLSSGPGATPVGLGLLALLALATLLAASRLRVGAALGFVLLAGVPAGGLAAALLFEPTTGGSAVARVLSTGALPLLLLGGVSLARPSSLGHLGRVAPALLVALGLALPVPLLDPAPAPVPSPAPLQGPAIRDAPDVVLTIVDTLRADAVPASGALADLAARGVRFENATSTAPWTLPSVTSILTGLLPSEHGATTMTRPLPPDVPTLAERFRAAGYQTIACTGGGFVRPEFGLARGFDVFDPEVELGFRPFRLVTPLAWRLLKNRYLTSERLVTWVGEWRGSDGLAAAALARWGARDPARPTFLLLHTYEVHDYYLRRPELDAGLGEPASSRFRGRFSLHPSELEGASHPDLVYFDRVYRHRAQHVDEVLGQLWEELRSEPSRPAVFAVVADHGEGFDATRHRVHHGGRLHQDLLHVPLILCAPGLPEGRTVADPVSTLDLGATLLELAGVAAGPYPGRSLVPRTSEATLAPRPAWSEERANGRDLLAVRLGRWKGVTERGDSRAYDLEADPLEDEPLEPPSEIARLLASFPEDHPPRQVAPQEVQGAALGHLQDLGYAE